MDPALVRYEVVLGHQRLARAKSFDYEQGRWLAPDRVLNPNVGGVRVRINSQLNGYRLAGKGLGWGDGAGDMGFRSIPGNLGQSDADPDEGDKPSGHQLTFPEQHPGH